MKIKRLKRQSFPDSSAASDIAFLLIIYFIVIAGFNVNHGFLMNLPAKDTARFILSEDLIRFEMDAEGRIVFENAVVDIGRARTLIQTAAAANPNIALILTIDPQAPWQSVVSFVELAQNLKIDSFSFSMSRAAGMAQ